MSAWDRQPGETAKAYAAFCAYRDLPRGERSVVAAYRKETGREGVQNPAGRWAEWSAAWDWKERAAAHDADLEKLAREKAEKDLVNERAARLKRQRQAAELLTGRGVEFLAAKKLDRPKDAIAAIVDGLKAEQRLDGMPDWLLVILNANGAQLDGIVADLQRGLVESTGDSQVATAPAPGTPAGNNGTGRH